MGEDQVASIRYDRKTRHWVWKLESPGGQSASGYVISPTLAAIELASVIQYAELQRMEAERDQARADAERG